MSEDDLRAVKFERQQLLDLCGKLQAENTSLRKEVERYRELLAYILPLAKGYAHEHPVGSNQKLVNLAEEAMFDEGREGRG